MPELPKILTRRRVTDSQHFRSEQVDIEFSNGEKRVYEYLKTCNHAAVIIVPMISKNEVLLVQEYGIGIEAYSWGLPKGGVDKGESFEEAANRELKEEAGYGARRLDRLKCMTQSPSYMQHKTQIVIAQDLYPERLEGDEPEALAVQAFNIDDIAAFAERDDISEARTIAALYLARDWLKNQS